MLELPAEEEFNFARNACAQWLVRADGAAQAAFQDLDLDPHAAGVLAPAHGEAAALQNQDLVALGQHVGQRRLPGAVAVRDVDVRPPLGAEHARDVAVQALGQPQQRPRVQVDRRPVHRPQDFVGHRGRPRNGQEFPAGA